MTKWILVIFTTTSSWNGYSTQCMMTSSYCILSSSSSANSYIGIHATHSWRQKKSNLSSSSSPSANEPLNRLLFMHHFLDKFENLECFIWSIWNCTYFTACDWIIFMHKWPCSIHLKMTSRRCLTCWPVKLWRCKMTSLVNKSGDWTPNYHKILIFSPTKIFEKDTRSQNISISWL